MLHPAKRRNQHGMSPWTVDALEPRLMLAADGGSAVVAATSDAASPLTESTTSDSLETSGSNTVVLVDEAVEDHAQLIAGIPAGADIVLIDRDSDPISQITGALEGRSNIESVQVISHGAAGQIQLGGTVIDEDTLEVRREEMARWSHSLAPGSDLLLYGCQTGAGDAGDQFLRRLADITGADVAASIDRTGTPLVSHARETAARNWTLENQIGTIETSILVAADVLDRYTGDLPIQIRAAGFEGDEQMELRIDGVAVASWDGLGTGGPSGQFNTFEYAVDGIAADRIQVAFTNDRWEPELGIDRNLRVDHIIVDGVIHETEDASVFSTGTWTAADGIVPGFRESEVLHTDGEFQFASQERNGTLIEVRARGTTGEERMSVLIDGQAVAAFDVSQDNQLYAYQAIDTVTADRVRVSFDNDRYEPELGIDRNLLVDFIQLDGERFQSEAGDVFSTGTWLPDDGITPGFRNSETLHTVGYFQYDADGGPVNNPGTIGLGETQVTVDEDAGLARIEVVRSGGSDGQATAWFQTVGIEATDGADFIGTDSGRIDFADGQTSAIVELSLIDDNQLETVETFRISLFRTEQAELGVPRTAIISIVDDDAGADLVGHWKLDENSIGQTVADESGLGNVGTHRNLAFPNGPSDDAPNTTSANPGSVTFDGTDDYISIGPSDSLDLSRTGQFTQSVWIKPQILDNNFHGILGYQGGGGTVNRYPGIWVDDQTRIHAGFGDGSRWNSFTTASVLTTGQWNHVATTFDGVTYKAYANGIEVYSTDDFSGRTPTGTNRVDIGRVDNYFLGGIDEVRIYNRALSGSEIDSLIDGADVPLPVIDGQFVTSDIAGGFTNPVAVDWLPDGRLLVAEQSGLVRIVNGDGSVAATPLLDIESIVNNGTKDRGMLGFAVHPDFENNPYVYVSYTYDPPEANENTGLGGPDGNGARVARVSRFTVVGDRADAASEVVLVGNQSTYENIGTPDKRPELNDPHSCFDSAGNPIEDCIPSDETSHTIGDLEFGPDGSLYISTGDGGSFGRADPVNLRSLDVDSLAGKILRVDPLTGDGLPDNPFFNGNADANESKVYSYGLRNPFRIAVNQTDGEVFAGDVGWTRWEEINTGRGANFGWPAFEGGGSGTSLRTSRYQDLAEVQAYYATNPDVTAPAWARLHSDGGRAIVMGDFIGDAYGSALEGTLLFTDIGDQILRAAQFDSSGTLTDVSVVSGAVGFLVDFQTGQDGRMYYTDLVRGTVGRLEFQSA